jgi:hypothetical protein
MHCAVLAPELSAIFNIVSCCIIFYFPSMPRLFLGRFRYNAHEAPSFVFAVRPATSHFDNIANSGRILLIVNHQPGLLLERFAVFRMPVHVTYGNPYTLAAALAYHYRFCRFCFVFLHPYNSLPEALLFFGLYLTLT